MFKDRSPLPSHLFHTLGVGDEVEIVRHYLSKDDPLRKPFVTTILAVDRSPDIGEDRSQGAPQFFVETDAGRECLNGAYVHAIISRAKKVGQFQPYNSLHKERDAYGTVEGLTLHRRGSMIAVSNAFALALAIVASDPQLNVPFGLSKARFLEDWYKSGNPGARGSYHSHDKTLSGQYPERDEGHGFTFHQVFQSWWMHLPTFKRYVLRRLPHLVMTLSEVKDKGALDAKRHYQDYLDDEEYDRKRDENEFRMQEADYANDYAVVYDDY